MRHRLVPDDNDNPSPNCFSISQKESNVKIAVVDKFCIMHAFYASHERLVLIRHKEVYFDLFLYNVNIKRKQSTSVRKLRVDTNTHVKRHFKFVLALSLNLDGHISLYLNN